MTESEKRPRYVAPQTMFKTLRRLHGHNLESQGLNNLSEAFQGLMTRARFFNFGRLRRTWSHSAVEFLRYRRLLPMLLSDEHELGSAFDDFKLSGDPCHSAGVLSERYGNTTVFVSGIPECATRAQTASFFSKFGEVQSCEFEDNRRRTMYATLRSRGKHVHNARIMFKRAESAEKARLAPPEELILYDSEMRVTIPTGKRATLKTNRRRVNTDEKEMCIERGADYYVTEPTEEGRLSRSSSVTLTDTFISRTPSNFQTAHFALAELPPRVLEHVLFFVGPIDRIRFERINKEWLEACNKAWTKVRHLSLASEGFFSEARPIGNFHLKALLRRCGVHLHSLVIGEMPNLLDDKAVNSIALLCPQLKEVDLSGLAASTNALQSLSEALTGLHRLSYRNMAHMRDKPMWALLSSSGDHLRELDLRGCSRIRGRFIKLLNAKLESVQFDGLARLDETAVEELCLKCPALHMLSLSGCYALTDAGLILLSRHLKFLRVLKLSGDQFTKLSAEGMLAISGVATLEELSVDYNPLVSSEIVSALASRQTNLRVLSMAYSGTDSTLSTEAMCQIGRLSKLEELCISGIAAINGAVLEQICNGCMTLRKLVARSCIYLGDNGMEAVKSLGALEHLDLSGCLLISRQAVQSVVKHYCSRSGTPLKLCIGGTLCEAGELSEASHIRLDFTDYSSVFGFHPPPILLGNISDGEADDDGDLQIPSTYRSQAGLEEEEDQSLPDNVLMGWAEKEAKEFFERNRQT